MESTTTTTTTTTIVIIIICRVITINMITTNFIKV
jgi:hypothetical protein